LGELHRRFGLFVVHVVIEAIVVIVIEFIVVVVNIGRDLVHAFDVLSIRYIIDEVRDFIHYLLGSLDELLGSVQLIFHQTLCLFHEYIGFLYQMLDFGDVYACCIELTEILLYSDDAAIELHELFCDVAGASPP
jgi:hypothetical protein